MAAIFEYKCELSPDEDSIKVQALSRSLIFVGSDDGCSAQTSVVLGREAVEKLRDELTNWLKSMEHAECQS